MRAAALALALLAVLASVVAGASPWDSHGAAKTESDRISKLMNNANAMKSEFKAWKQAHGKGAEGDARYATWKTNMASIIAQNKKEGATWWAAPNEFTDLTFDEFAAKFTGMDVNKAPIEDLKRAAAASRQTGKKATRRMLQTAPAAHDWVAAGGTTPVKNQGGCGSCWAFAAVGALEAAYKIRYNLTVDMSEQQVTSCDPYDGGCNGGWPSSAFRYIYESKITTESNYPYLSGSYGQLACDATKASGNPRYGPSTPYGYATVASNSRTALINAIYNNGPTTIAFQVESAFQSYRGGIFSTACASTSVNHAMVAVGYDTGLGFFKIRNSWGSGWGEAGHIRVAMRNDSPGIGLCSLHKYGGWYPNTIAAPAANCPTNCATCDVDGVCQSCKSGWDGAGCTTPICPANCAACSSPTTCTSCKAGWSGTSCATASCANLLTPCVAGEFCAATANGGVCTACSTECATCTNADACTTCAAGANFDPAKGCLACKAGWTGADCASVVCPANCASCSSPTTCTLCKPGWSGATCATASCTNLPTPCVAGEFCAATANGGVCTACSPSCATCTSATSCSSCPGNFALPSCTTCKSGWTGTGCNTVQACLAKNKYCSSHSQCCSGSCNFGSRKCR